ncbi:immunoglobulin domain-containing protein, partial [Staphylococcus aureus]|uniref:immunoglobulin domain-containing protein n=1 Tax=Staphylococcus aureus TaxID=1280 RepID=UPI0038B328C0
MCVASNSRGQASAEVIVEVLHAPGCALTREEEGEDVILICQGSANPDNVNFTWTKDDEEI